MNRSLFSTGLLFALGLALSACAPDSSTQESTSPASTSGATASRTPTPTPTPTPRASAVVIGMTNLTVLDEQGAVMQELSFSTPGSDVAYKLSQVFGLEPAQSDSDGGLEWWPTHNYKWNGFELRDELRDESKPQPYYQYYIVVTTAQVNGIEIRTAAGTQVGDPAGNVVFDPTSIWEPWSYDGSTCGAEALFSENGNIENSVTLYLCTDDATGLVSRFSVPVGLQI